MQNFEMLKELGRTNKPILLKRGLANTIKELLMAAEYIMQAATIRSSFANAASAPTKPPPAIRLTSLPCRCFTKKRTSRW